MLFRGWKKVPSPAKEHNPARPPPAGRAAGLARGGKKLSPPGAKKLRLGRAAGEEAAVPCVSRRAAWVVLAAGVVMLVVCWKSDPAWRLGQADPP